MFRSPASEEHGQLFKVVLSGGPPWGFTLTGGSEFGSRLCVKKVGVLKGLYLTSCYNFLPQFFVVLASHSYIGNFLIKFFFSS